MYGLTKKGCFAPNLRKELGSRGWTSIFPSDQRGPQKILSFVAAYNEFLFALVLITKEDNFTLPVALSGFMRQNDEHFFGIFAAASCIGSIPILVLWFLLQKQIIAGLTRGAIQ